MQKGHENTGHHGLIYDVTSMAITQFTADDNSIVTISNNTMSVIRNGTIICEFIADKSFIYRNKEGCMLADGTFMEYNDYYDDDDDPNRAQIISKMQTSDFFVEMYNKGRIKQVFWDLAPGMTSDMELWYTVSTDPALKEMEQGTSCT